MIRAYLVLLTDDDLLILLLCEARVGISVVATALGVSAARALRRAQRLGFTARDLRALEVRR